MQLIQTRHQRGSKQRQRRIEQQDCTWQAHPPRAQPQQTHRSVTDKVTGLADVMVQNLPAGIGNLSEKVFPNPPQGTARMIGSEIRARFNHDHADGRGNRPPRAYPESSRAASFLQVCSIQRDNSVPRG